MLPVQTKNEINPKSASLRLYRPIEINQSSGKIPIWQRVVNQQLQVRNQANVFYFIFDV